MQSQFRSWTVALACSALVLIVAPQSIAQTLSNGTAQQAMTKQQALMTDGSQKVMDASKKMQHAVQILNEKGDYAKARQLLAEANKTMTQGAKLIAYAERIDAALLQDVRRTEEAGRQMMKERQAPARWNADDSERRTSLVQGS